MENKIKSVYGYFRAPYFVFTLIATLFLAASLSPAFAATETNKEAATKATKDNGKSFKRFEISYGSMWLSGKYEQTIMDRAETWPSFGVGSDKITIKSRLRTRLEVYKAGFYFTPKTHIEGSLATGDFVKDEAGYVNIFDIRNFFGFNVTRMPLHLSGDKINIWNVDLYQNLYTHKNTGFALDIFAGFISYQEKLRLKYSGEVTDGISASDPLFAFDRRLSGPRLGFKYQAPFTLPKLPKNPFTFGISASYAHLLALRGNSNIAPIIIIFPLTSTDSRSSKGYILDTSASLSCQLNPYLSIELAYNYMLIRQSGGNYPQLNPDFSIVGIREVYEIGKIVNVYHGPSIAIKGRF
ncbi:MAG: hypothetical protein PHU91_03135 [Candidatus Omnitrophica bacterium]|nr:hypothetical protein [Candidatus Omnitrophota bacterium]MDD5236635.1 hypothetical protein [Candidatus Omnitrophota bacterium]MDD5611162.1 hypothetical protein [Candidatus Omnitrophota bacterium]